MKRLIKRALRPFWRMTSPIRRPFVRRIDDRIHRMVCAAVQAQVMPPIRESLESSSRALERLEHSLGSANHAAQLMAVDMELMLGSLVREVARLQAQVEEIRDTIDEANGLARSGLSLVGSGHDDGPVSLHAGVERARVG